MATVRVHLFPLVWEEESRHTHSKNIHKSHHGPASEMNGASVVFPNLFHIAIVCGNRSGGVALGVCREGNPKSLS